MKRIITLLALVGLAASLNAHDIKPVPAEPEKASPLVRVTDWSKSVVAIEQGDFFAANEIRLSLAASYLNAERSFSDVFDTNVRGGDWGVNLGLDYFPGKYIGFGVEANVNNLNDPDPGLLSSLGASITLRYPMGRFCPYVAGVFGRDLADGEYYIGPRLGAALALNERAALFADTAYQSKNRTDSLLTRFGISLSL